ncbi:hypothetical protein EU642_22285 [Salmonella enterica]|nr:hypothetical protein [Salmonella enterica]EAO0118583.1 hypothetical protein [Salmonella enterica]EAO3601686.1 hypothetical protein [Salmonella enterica]EAR6391581.1 hypothetical protein [Salmonella enterica]EAV1285345.1 hypothetical protein [Salmonella enterica]
MYISVFGLICAGVFILWSLNRKDKDINALRYEVESLTYRLESAKENLQTYYAKEDRARESLYYIQSQLLEATSEDLSTDEVFDLYRKAQQAVNFFENDSADAKNTPW